MISTDFNKILEVFCFPMDANWYCTMDANWKMRWII